MSLNVKITGDNDDLKQKLEESRQKILGLGDTAQEVSAKIERSMKLTGEALFKALFDTAAKQSVSEMRTIAAEAEKMYKALQSGSYDDSFGVTKEQFEGISSSDAKMGQMGKAIDDVRKKATDSENTFQKVSNALNEIFSAGEKKDLTASFKALAAGLTEINDMAKSVGGNISTLFSSFGDEKAASMATHITALVGGVGQAGAGVAKIAAGDMIGGIKDLATGITNVVTSIAGMHDAAKEKEIQRLQSQVDGLKESYDKLSKAIGKAYSADAATLIKQQDENLLQQKKLLEAQIQAEEGKKNTDKNKVKQYKDTIKGIDDTLAESKDKITAAIIGKDVSAAINEFANAYVDAWAAGEDKAASMKEAVRKMIKSAITELVKSRLSPEVNAFMDYLATAMNDGILTLAEQHTLDALEASIYNKLNGLDDSLNKYVEDKKTDERSASSKSVASMSQDSANELNGRFAAMQALTYEICTNIHVLSANSQSMLLLVSGISEQTKSLGRLEAIERDIELVKNSMSDIALKGIMIKK
jgi:uncharacterized protein YeaC (DUF1315 family)